VAFAMHIASSSSSLFVVELWSLHCRCRRVICRVGGGHVVNAGGRLVDLLAWAFCCNHRRCVVATALSSWSSGRCVVAVVVVINGIGGTCGIVVIVIVLLWWQSRHWLWECGSTGAGVHIEDL